MHSDDYYGHTHGIYCISETAVSWWSITSCLTYSGLDGQFCGSFYTISGHCPIAFDTVCTVNSMWIYISNERTWLLELKKKYIVYSNFRYRRQKAFSSLQPPTESQQPSFLLTSLSLLVQNNYTSFIIYLQRCTTDTYNKLFSDVFHFCFCISILGIAAAEPQISDSDSFQFEPALNDFWSRGAKFSTQHTTYI